MPFLVLVCCCVFCWLDWLPNQDWIKFVGGLKLFCSWVDVWDPDDENPECWEFLLSWKEPLLELVFDDCIFLGVFFLLLYLYSIEYKIFRIRWISENVRMRVQSFPTCIMLEKLCLMQYLFWLTLRIEKWLANMAKYTTVDKSCSYFIISLNFVSFAYLSTLNL